MSLDVEFALKDILKMKDKEFNSYFVVDEVGDNIEIAIRKNSKGRPVWLERSTWIGVNNYVKDKDGKWDKNRSTWLIPLDKIKQPKREPKAIPIDKIMPPKEPGKEPRPITKEMPTAADIQDEAAYLKPTYEKLGPLIPVFQTPSGEIIDGIHRRELDPGWFGIVLHNISDPVKLAMARLVVNVVRRKVPAEEKTELLGQIAKLTGWTPQEIADSLGMSYTWVMKYLPDEYKERPGQGPKEYPVTRRVTETPITSVTPGFESDQVMRAIDLAPPEIQPKLKEVAVEKKLTPDETATLVSVIQETPKEKWPEVLLTPRTAIQSYEEKRPKQVKIKPKEFDVGEFNCPKCGFKALLVHVDPNEHKFVRFTEESADN